MGGTIPKMQNCLWGFGVTPSLTAPGDTLTAPGDTRPIVTTLKIAAILANF